MRAGKKTRRMISLVLSLALILTMYIPVHAETPADPLHMTASSDSLEVGGTVTVTLTLDEFDTKNMTGGIAWDSGLMTLTAYSGSRGTATVYVQQYSRDFEEWDRVNARTSTIEEAGVTGTFGFYVNADGTTVEKLRQDPDYGPFLTLSFEIAAAADVYTVYMYQSSDTGSGTITYDPKNNEADRTSENTKSLYVPRNIADAAYIQIGEKTYTGSPIELTSDDISVFWDEAHEEPLTFGTDYEISGYSNNTNAGTATVRLSGLGVYAGSTKDAEFTINKATPVLSFPSFEVQRTYGQDPFRYPASGADNITYSSSDPGVATVAADGTITIVAVGNTLITANAAEDANHNEATGTSYTFYVVAASIEGAEIGGIEAETYNGEEHKPEPAVTFNGKTLVKDTDYTLSWSENINAGDEAKVTVTGKGNFTGAKSAEFTIEKAVATAENISWEPGTVYEGMSLSDLTFSGTVVPEGSAITAVESQATLTAGINEVELCITPPSSASGNYTDGSAVISVTALENTLTGIEVTTLPTKTTYYIGSSLETEGMVVMGNYAYGDPAELTDYDIDPEVFDEIGEEITVTVSCGQVSDEFTVEVTKIPQNIAVDEPDDLTYGDSGVSIGIEGAVGTVSFSSSNDSIVTVDAEGKLTATGVGSTVVTVNISGDETYESASITVDITVVAADMANADIGGIGAETYDGEEHKPEPVVTFNGKTLVKDTDYTLSWADNTDAGTASVTVTGKGNFTGAKSAEFTIEKAAATASEIVCTNEAIYEGMSYGDLAFSGTTVPEGSSITAVESQASLVPGSNTVGLLISPPSSASGNYTDGSAVISVTALENTLTGIEVTTLPTKKEYLVGESLNTEGMVVTASYADGSSAAVSSYTVSPTTFGTAGEEVAVTVSYENFTDDFTVKVSLKTQTISASVDGPLTYLGAGGTVTVSGAQTDLSFASNDEDVVSVSSDGSLTANGVGTADITVTAAETNEYASATATVGVTVNAADIADAEIAQIEAVTYNGESHKPEPAVTYNGNTLVKDTDYTLSWAENINVGEGVVTVTGKGNFTGSNDAFFTIRQAEATAEDISWEPGTVYEGMSFGDLTFSGTVVPEGAVIAPVTPDHVFVEGRNAVNLSVDPGDNENYYIGQASVKITALANSLTGIEVTQLPTKKDYLVGESLVTEGMVVMGSYAYGDPVPVTGYTVSPETFDTAGEEVMVTVSCGGFDDVFTVNVSKGQQTISLGEDLTVIYGDPDFILEVTGAQTAVTFTSSNEEVVTVDSESGEVTIVRVGDAVITAAAAEDGAYESAADSITVTVNAASLNDAVMSSISDVTYNGQPHTPEPSVNLGDLLLIKDTDYTLSYQNNTDAGDAAVTATGIGNYTGSVSGRFEIGKAQAEAENVAVSSPEKIFESTPIAEVVLSGDCTPQASEGQLALDAGQSFTAGENLYSWTFDPQNNNYTPATGSITINVLANSLESIELATGSAVTVYQYGDSFDKESVSLRAVFADGTVIDPVDPGELVIEPEVFDEVGDQIPVTVTYKDKSVSLTVQVGKADAPQLSADAAEAPTDGEFEISVSGIPEDAHNLNISAQCSDDSVTLNVNDDGSITAEVMGAEDGGSATVTVTVSSDNYEDAVIEIPVSFNAPRYSITVKDGTADKDTAKEGETVTVTWTSKTNYQFTGWTSDTEGVEFEDASAESTSVAMPASDVTVTAQSKKKTSGGGGSSSGSGSSGSSSEPEQMPEEKEKFTDVPGDAYYHDPVYWAVEKGITEGTSPTTFSPMAPTTRADFVTFLWRAAGSPKVSGEMPFEDVSESAYYYDAVLWAYVNGITEGTTPTTFRPDRTVTRGQAVTFLHRNAGEPGVGDTNPFTDVEESDYYYAPILWAVEKKIVEGTTPTTFSPNRDSYRAEVVTMLYRELAK
ncbi:MAG: S-layer homology domain-containing protein [Firmicutes bacterium]|nr:S-layer homology domain-containing protein [Bacillota bacterium]